MREKRNTRSCLKPTDLHFRKTLITALNRTMYVAPFKSHTCPLLACFSCRSPNDLFRCVCVCVLCGALCGALQELARESAALEASLAGWQQRLSSVKREHGDVSSALGPLRAAAADAEARARAATASEEASQVRTMLE